jgi:hypothetical protein
LPSGRAGVIFRGLIDTLRQREVEALGRSSPPSRPPSPIRRRRLCRRHLRQRLALASGRFAMIDDGLGFQLVPWSPSLERSLAARLRRRARRRRRWGFGRKRGLGL